MSLEIKGIMVPALSVKFDPEISIDENLSELDKKISSTFFNYSKVVINTDNMDLKEEDMKKIETMLKKHNASILGTKTSTIIEHVERRIPAKYPKERKTLKTINKTLRGGQSIEHDGDLVVIGNINPDAYLIATGNIIVMGILRGVVHAGASGDEAAVVIALKLKPQQLRIANCVTRSPDDDVLPEYPEKAFIIDNTIYIEKI
ncbi:septum site-determining protein MinC [Candidatus Magnetoovum chiemensis]|nr:septum site-determining protein MinC [Candidatus Magnetoovum chiemensis]